MELTFTDRSWADVGLLDASSSDWAWGADENDFEIILSETSGVPEVGALVYGEDGDVGGIVRGYESEYETGVLRVRGDTWAGVLDCFTLCPPSGAAYYSVSGSMRSCVSSLLSRLGVGWLFTVSSASSTRQVSHTFKGARSSTQSEAGRFMGGWAALWQLAADNGMKVRMRYDAALRKVSVTVMPRKDWTDAESIDAGLAQVKVSTSSPVNHLVCLGEGELEQRTVLHLYADERGNVSTHQTLTGADEISATYDYASSDDLAADGAKKLREEWEASQEVKVGTSGEGAAFEVGDLIGGTDAKTGIYAEAVVTKKVVRIDGAEVTTTYESTVRS